jgi:segregation and condensation protein B
MRFAGKLQFSSNPDYAEAVENILNPIKERELSKAMMEVSAIIAYKQPVTRLEIEEIRE